MQVKLKVVGGKNDGREVAVKGPKFYIGRSEECHLRPKTETISRKHCVIVINEDGVAIFDLKSRNGVYVNDKKIEKGKRLRGGETLTIGKLIFEVVIDHSIASAKKPKVKDVKEAAARTAASAGKGAIEDGDVASWLDEADSIDRARQLSDPDTVQMNIEETERLVLKRESDEADPADNDKENSETLVIEQDKKEPGKLPKDFSKSKDSTEAASQMLRKFFNRS